MVWGVRKVKYAGTQTFEDTIAVFTSQTLALEFADMGEPFLANNEELWVDTYEKPASGLCRHSFKFKNHGGEQE
jgi:hypothetical protein